MSEGEQRGGLGGGRMGENHSEGENLAVGGGHDKA